MPARTTIPGSLAAALAVASLSVAACSSSPACLCASGSGDVTLKATHFAAVSAEAPCTAATDGSSGRIVVYRDTPGTCRVRAEIGDGNAYTFSVEFQAAASGCCAGNVQLVDASAPEFTDAGAD